MTVYRERGNKVPHVPNLDTRQRQIIYLLVIANLPLVKRP